MDGFHCALMYCLGDGKGVRLAKSLCKCYPQSFSISNNNARITAPKVSQYQKDEPFWILQKQQ